jgi:hypothetical protein
MIILLQENNGRSSAINLAKYSWETEVVPGDDSQRLLTLDDGRTFNISADKYKEIITALGKTDGFMLI